VSDQPKLQRYDIDGDGILYGNENGDWIRAEDVDAELARLRERVGELEREQSAAISIIQRHQPGGSPPPGNWVCLAAWVLGELTKDAALNAAAREVAIAAIEVVGLNSQLGVAQISGDKARIRQFENELEAAMTRLDIVTRNNAEHLGGL
jgi:hypothetical protein